MFALALAIAASGLAGWLLYRVKVLQDRVEELQARVAGMEQHRGREDSGSRVRELLGSRSWAATPTLKEAQSAAGDVENPTDPGLRAVAAR
jgi:hypothetical protein